MHVYLNHANQERIFYVTGDHIRKDTNLSIHIMLLSIEDYFNNTAYRPHTYYHTVDGGSENANKLLLGVLVLLVATGVFQHVEMQRLPSNHHHDDCDQAFGNASKTIHPKDIFTFSQWKTAVENSTQDITPKTQGPDRKYGQNRVVFIDCVPNYQLLLDSCIDPEFGRVFKEEQTHHIALFTKAAASAHQHKVGVHQRMRQYYAEYAFELKELTEEERRDDPSSCGKSSIRCNEF